MSRANPRFRRLNPSLPAPTGNVIQLTIFGTLENQVTLNILYYQDPTGTVASITNLGNLMAAWLVANSVSMLACSSSDWTYQQLKSQYVNQPTIIPQYNVSGPTSGTGPALHEPTTMAAILSKATLVKGQSGRGRYYVPGIPLANVTSSALTAGSLATYQTYATKLNTVVVAGGLNYTPGIFSRRGFNKVTGQGGGFSPMSAVTAKALLGNIRRRRIGRGK